MELCADDIAILIEGEVGCSCEITDGKMSGMAILTYFECLI